MQMYNGLPETEAKFFQQKADSILESDAGRWRAGLYFPYARFSYAQLPGKQIQFAMHNTVQDSIRWHFGDGTASTAPDPLKTYTANGSYRVTLSVYQNGCGDIYNTTITVNETASLDEKNNQECLLYPNPAHGNVYIMLADGMETATYEITDINGRTLQSGQFTGNSHHVLAEGLARGMYIVKLYGGNGHRELHKLLVE